MPKLLVFAPCEKVIISQDENNPTLIAILSQVGGTIQPAKDQPILPENAVPVIPMRWSVFALWQRSADEDDKTFVQTIKLISPARQLRIEARQEIVMNKPSHRIVVRVDQFPAESGLWELQVFMTEKGASLPEMPLASYPLLAEFNVET